MLRDEICSRRSPKSLDEIFKLRVFSNFSVPFEILFRIPPAFTRTSVPPRCPRIIARAPKGLVSTNEKSPFPYKVTDSPPSSFDSCAVPLSREASTFASGFPSSLPPSPGGACTGLNLSRGPISKVWCRKRDSASSALFITHFSTLTPLLQYSLQIVSRMRAVGL